MIKFFFPRDSIVMNGSAEQKENVVAVVDITGTCGVLMAMIFNRYVHWQKR